MEEKKIRICKFCKCDISHLHQNCNTCYSVVCREKFEEDRRKRITATNKTRYKKGPDQRKKYMQHGNKNIDEKVRRCRICNHIIKNGNFMYCEFHYRELLNITDRIDGDHIY